MRAASRNDLTFAELSAAIGADLGTTPAATLGALLAARDGKDLPAVERATAGKLLATLLGGTELPPRARFHHYGDQLLEQWDGTVLCRTADTIAIGGLDWRMVNVRAHPDPPDVAWVQVTPMWRRRGIATALLAAASYEAGALLAPTLATEAGAAWGPRARARVAAIRLSRADLRALRRAVAPAVSPLSTKPRRQTR